MLEEYRASAKLIDHVTIKLRLSVLVLCYSPSTQNSRVAKSVYHRLFDYYVREHPLWGKSSHENIYWNASSIRPLDYQIILPNGTYIKAIPYEDNRLEHRLMGRKALALLPPESLNDLQHLPKNEHERLYNVMKNLNGRYLNGIS